VCYRHVSLCTTQLLASSCLLKGLLMNPHVHITPVHLVASVAAVVAVFGTIHLLCLTSDNRVSRAIMSLGF